MTGIDWQPTLIPDALQARAALLAGVREFFAARGVLEVETPALSQAASSDPNLASLSVLLQGDRRMYLHTSPEFPMKRLLAAGSGDIFQVSRVFRDGESGRLHNPEFTLLEWYRLGFSMRALMQEVAELLATLLRLSQEAAANVVYVSYRELCLAHLGVDPLQADGSALLAELGRRAVAVPEGVADKDALLDLAMSALVLPALPRDQLTFIFDYPASQASLASLNPDDERTARRFEAVLGGMELCNGFEELRDADEQRARFERENAERRARGLQPVPTDERLLAALAEGLPACAGVAVGIDRVLMLALGAEHIDQVLAFPVERA